MHREERGDIVGGADNLVVVTIFVRVVKGERAVKNSGGRRGGVDAVIDREEVFRVGGQIALCSKESG